MTVNNDTNTFLGLKETSFQVSIYIKILMTSPMFKDRN